MRGFKTLLSIAHLLPPEFAHQLALLGLRIPAWSFWPMIDDPYDWHGLRFRNRVGIAAGFDKNGIALRGMETLGAGFVEVGTILVKPWQGNSLRPRVKRFTKAQAIWNRLGFPSQGLERIRKNLQAFPPARRNGLVVGCNIGPHPGNLDVAKSGKAYLETACDELLQLAMTVFEHADFFVVNLSSPNTPGLRTLLHDEDLSAGLFLPVRQAIRRLDAESGRPHPTPMLVKLPPEDADRVSWTRDSLKAVVEPLIASDACDGFVAVNTSSRLAAKVGEQSGGISGRPLGKTALQVVHLLRNLIGPDHLIFGAGGITAPEHAVEFLEAGSNLVEIYSGLVYRGPDLLASCAAALRDHSPRSVPAL